MSKVRDGGSLVELSPYPVRSDPTSRYIVSESSWIIGCLTGVQELLGVVGNHPPHHVEIGWSEYKVNSLNRNFAEEDVSITNKYMKKYSTALAIRETQINTIMRHH